MQFIFCLSFTYTRRIGLRVFSEFDGMGLVAIKNINNLIKLPGSQKMINPFETFFKVVIQKGNCHDAYKYIGKILIRILTRSL